MSNWPNPFIEQRADPYILRHQDHYYFIASFRNMTGWRFVARRRWKVYAKRRRWWSGVKRRAAQ